MRVSVRLMTYNHANYIEKALKGIDRQITNFEFEAVVGDDFSTDNTLQKARDFKVSNPNLTIRILKRTKGDAYDVIRQARGRLYNFVNIIENCIGEYIALLDGDDYWIDPLKLQKQVDFLEANDDFSGCFHNTFVINESKLDSILKPWRIYDKNTFQLKDTISTTALFHSSSFMFRKKKLSMPSWFLKIQSADMALFTLVASKGFLYRIDETMSVYRKNETGITNFIKIKEYHKNRIKLNRFYKKSFDKSVHSKIDEVLEYHTSELSKAKSGVFSKLKALIRF